MCKNKIKAVSLCTSAGIGELLLDDLNVEVVVANELIEKRARVYTHFNPNTKMIEGNLTEERIKSEIIEHISSDVNLLLATPPCQGLSSLGKNKNQSHFEEDERNFIIFDIMDIIDIGKFDYILIENVPKFLDMYFPYKGDFINLTEILNDKYGDEYHIDSRVLNAKDYGVAQTRPRAIIKMFKKHLNWDWPETEKEITLKEAIGHLPSLESGEDSGIPWHYAKEENERAVLALQHTPTGKSALKNEIYYPKKKDGSRITGFHNTFKRMTWDQPAHARTTYCGSMSSHNNVHPGYKKTDGTYSDARVLTLLETFLVSSIPSDINFPDWCTDNFIRTLIGESIPPLMLKKIILSISDAGVDKVDKSGGREEVDFIQTHE